MTGAGRLPTEVEDGVRALVGTLTGRTPAVVEATRVGGGCINHASRVRLDEGEDLFVKWNPDRPSDFFSAEAQGLEALGAASLLRVPAVLGVSEADAPGPSWLALEYVPEGRPSRGFDTQLGNGLAALHRGGSREAEMGPSSRPWGWTRDNYIGSLPQINDSEDRWPAFWRRARLEPQTRRADSLLDAGDRRRLQRVFHRLDAVLEAGDAEGPSLLHGDLWSGNVYPGPDGRPVLVDPAVYRGHREVDLAMTELFGGFSAAFREAYEGAWRLRDRYPGARRAVYQLYPLLVHVNLFGRSYLEGLRRALDAALT